MQTVLQKLETHLPAIVMVAVVVLNILIKDNSVHLSVAWTDSINAVLGLVGLGAHVNNHR